MQVTFYLAGEITQVIDSIPWVRCASGNVLGKVQQFPAQTWATNGPIVYWAQFKLFVEAFKLYL